MTPKISTIVLVKNAEELIVDCLDSVSWTDEIVVIDDGATDRTAEIAEKKGARVIQAEGGNFSERRNLGAKEAKGDWLLYVDVDERVTPLLKKEIISKVAKTDFSGLAIPRSNILLGKKMRWGGWWPDYVLRLIKKDALIGWKGELHEQPEIQGKVGKLKNPLTHITHRTLSEMVEKTNEWSEIEARLLLAANHPKMAWWRFFSIALREFWKRGVVNLGFLDGTVGVIEIIFQMYSRMITYAKLWEMQLSEKK